MWISTTNAKKTKAESVKSCVNKSRIWICVNTSWGSCPVPTAEPTGQQQTPPVAQSCIHHCHTLGAALNRALHCCFTLNATLSYTEKHQLCWKALVATLKYTIQCCSTIHFEALDSRCIIIYHTVLHCINTCSTLRYSHLGLGWVNRALTKPPISSSPVQH